jgi:hypothetical protein
VANDGHPISAGAGDSTRPDITFSGNTPYVSWREDVGGGVEKAFVGHFINPSDPTFVLDSSDTSLAATSTADVREPISSGCTANPFNSDGATCQGGAVGTPFLLYTSGTSPLGLFADAYQLDTPTTGGASGVGQASATVTGSVNPMGARTSVGFQFGTTTAYGQSTPAQMTGPDTSSDSFTAALSGLAAGTTIHYRAVANGDFGTQFGADQTLTTSSASVPAGTVVPGKASVGRTRVSGTTAWVSITCRGDTSCVVSLKLTVRETLRKHRVVAVVARRIKLTHRTVTVGTASATVQLRKAVRIGLNRTGRKLLAARRRFTAKLTVTQRIAGKNRTISTRRLKFKARRRAKH